MGDFLLTYTLKRVEFQIAVISLLNYSNQHYGSFFSQAIHDLIIALGFFHKVLTHKKMAIQLNGQPFYI